jgi:hypothetical protein
MTIYSLAQIKEVNTQIKQANRKLENLLYGHSIDDTEEKKAIWREKIKEQINLGGMINMQNSVNDFIINIDDLELFKFIENKITIFYKTTFETCCSKNIPKIGAYSYNKIKDKTKLKQRNQLFFKDWSWEIVKDDFNCDVNIFRTYFLQTTKLTEHFWDRVIYLLNREKNRNNNEFFILLDKLMIDESFNYIPEKYQDKIIKFFDYAQNNKNLIDFKKNIIFYNKKIISFFEKKLNEQEKHHNLENIQNCLKINDFHTLIKCMSYIIYSKSSVRNLFIIS